MILLQILYNKLQTNSDEINLVSAYWKNITIDKLLIILLIVFLGIIYIMPQRYKRHSESFGFLEKLYVLYYMKKLKTLSIYSFMMLFPDEASALRYIEKNPVG